MQAIGHALILVCQGRCSLRDGRQLPIAFEQGKTWARVSRKKIARPAAPSVLGRLAKTVMAGEDDRPLSIKQPTCNICWTLHSHHPPSSTHAN